MQPLKHDIDHQILVTHVPVGIDITHRSLCHDIQSKLSHMHDQWWNARAVEIQGNADHHATKDLDLHSPKHTSTVPLKSVDSLTHWQKSNPSVVMMVFLVSLEHIVQHHRQGTNKSCESANI